MSIVKNKAEKIKMDGIISYVKLRRKLLKWQFIFKVFKPVRSCLFTRSQTMLLLEFSDGKGVYVLQQVLANLHFSVGVFLNFAKGNICNYCSYVVVSPLASFIWMKDRDNILKRKNKLWTQSTIAVR